MTSRPERGEREGGKGKGLTLGLGEVDGAVGLVGGAGRLLHQLHVAHAEGGRAQVEAGAHFQPLAAGHGAGRPLGPVGDGALRVRLQRRAGVKRHAAREREEDSDLGMDAKSPSFLF